MVEDNPLLSGLFDEVRKVVGKIYVYDCATIERKALSELIFYVAGLPEGIGVL